VSAEIIPIRTGSDPIAKSEKYKLVHVIWEDSRLPSIRWTHAEDFVPPDATTCETVGWIVYQDARIVCVTQSICDGGKQFASVMEIPARAIIEIKELKHA
jgi:hypothetical protein